MPLYRTTAGQLRVLFQIVAADLNTTADQVYTKIGSFNSYQINNVSFRDSSGAASSAVGGIYTAAAKGGIALIAASTAFTALAGANNGFGAGVTAAGLVTLTATPILSLSTPHGSAATARALIIGWAL